MAARRMTCGVSKSGSPRPKLMTLAPDLAKALARAMIASVAGGLRRETRAESAIGGGIVERIAEFVGLVTAGGRSWIRVEAEPWLW